MNRLTIWIILIGFFSGCSWFEDDDNNLNEGVPIPNTDFFMPLGLYDIRVHGARISPDGKWMLWDQTYSDSIPQGFYIMNLETYESHILFESPFAGSFEWSADGQWIVFWNDQYIYTMKANGDSVKLLTHGYSPDWSPDGEWIVFDRSLESQEGPAGMFIMKRDGSQLQWFGHGGIPQWNKNTNEIVFIRGDINNSKIFWFYFHDYAKGIVTDSIAIISPGWSFSYELSSNGKKIIYSDIYGIWLLDRKTRKSEKIVQNDLNGENIQKGNEHLKLYVEAPSWYPDSKHFVYAHFNITRVEHSDYDGTLIEGRMAFYKSYTD